MTIFLPATSLTVYCSMHTSASSSGAFGSSATWFICVLSIAVMVCPPSLSSSR